MLHLNIFAQCVTNYFNGTRHIGIAQSSGYGRRLKIRKVSGSIPSGGLNFAVSMCESEKFAEQIKQIEANRANQIEQIESTSTVNRANQAKQANRSSIHSANRANNMNIRVYICPIRANRTNRSSYICIIHPIRPVNWFDLQSKSNQLLSKSCKSRIKLNWPPDSPDSHVQILQISVNRANRQIAQFAHCYFAVIIC